MKIKQTLSLDIERCRLNFLDTYSVDCVLIVLLFIVHNKRHATGNHVKSISHFEADRPCARRAVA